MVDAYEAGELMQRHAELCDMSRSDAWGLFAQEVADARDCALMSLTTVNASDVSSVAEFQSLYRAYGYVLDILPRLIADAREAMHRAEDSA